MEPVRFKDMPPISTFDPILAEEIFKGMAQYELFSIKEVNTAIPRAVEVNIPSLHKFLDKRLKKYNLFTDKSWKKNYFYKNASSLLFCQKNMETNETDETYVTSHCFSAWPSRRKAAQELFLNNCNDVQAYSEIDFRILDIPELLSPDSSVGEDFIA